MKKLLLLVLSAVMMLAMFTGCGKKGVEGSVATDGSTSMEKVIGALGESFTKENSDVKFTYNPTGSGSGITAVSGYFYRPDKLCHQKQNCKQTA